MKILFKALAVLIVGVFAVIGFQAFRFLAAGPGNSSDQVVFEVPNGKTFGQIAAELEAKGLVLDRWKMRILARLTGQGSRVKRGEYALNRGMTPQEILAILVSGKSIMYPVTIPEGSNLFDIATILEAKGLYKSEEFLKMTRDKQVASQLLGIEVSSLEGYLFPETYNVTKFTPMHELLASMVDNFKRTWSVVESQGNSAPLGLARHELVTLASVVEKETGAPEERPMIASVFYNRMKKNMRLQSDPTIIYGLWLETGSYKQNISKADITHATRYNTYTVPRLPFGPISNPGREALAAVLKPATTDYLYFVSKNDGTHIFTRTYEEHAKAVQGFQLDPTAREGKSWRDLKKKK